MKKETGTSQDHVNTELFLYWLGASPLFQQAANDMRLDYLQQRAELLDRLRTFFRERGFLEIETPLVSNELIPERHIRPVALADGERHLQASPELHMKRLLCNGIGPIFQVTRSFRGDERGKHHHPEFTIVEWYRPGDDMLAGMDLLSELMQELLSLPSAKRTSYREAFERVLGIDPHTATVEELQSVALEKVPSFDVMLEGMSEEDQANRDEWLNLLLDQCVEPTLGKTGPEILYHYPVTQSALAKTVHDDRGQLVAERFELYAGGLELANGYHELTDSEELRERLELVNRQRVAAGSPALPMPEKLLTAMQSPGLPACAGVALGFDRLVMLATGADSIDEVTAFPS